MIVILVAKLGNGDVSKSFGGVQCDVIGCDAIENGPEESSPKNLAAAGWFIQPGVHRCPKHFDEDAPPRGVEHREVEQVTKRI